MEWNVNGMEWMTMELFPQVCGGGGMEWSGMEWNGMEWNENVNWMDETAERFFFPRAAPRDHTIALAAFGGYSRRC